MTLREVHDLTSAERLFDAAVYPSVITATRSVSDSEVLRVSCRRGDSLLEWAVGRNTLPFDESAGSPWIIAPPDVRRGFDALRRAGIPFAQSAIGRPMLGVKTGCNDAFVVARGSSVEKSMLRPMIRGERVRPWSLPEPHEEIIWTHDSLGPLKTLPTEAARYLLRWRHELERRADLRAQQRWWMLFRTEAADCTYARVVWPDIGRTPRAALIPAGVNCVPLNSCYVARCRDPADGYALTALLNSQPIAAWLALLAEPARGGYLRFMGWTMALLPLPSDWIGARSTLAPIGESASEGRPPRPEELTRAVLHSYGVSAAEVNALLQWSE
jgi:hypothetical protein